MILALDLSTCTGWVAGEPGSKPKFGVWKLPSIAEPGRQGCAFIDVLADTLAVFRPSLVMMEADVNLHKQNPTSTAYQQIGMAYTTEFLCWRHEYKLRQASANEARAKILGRCRWPGKGEAKGAVLEWCRSQGFDFLDHNIADAYVLWRYACLQLATQRRAA